MGTSNSHKSLQKPSVIGRIVQTNHPHLGNYRIIRIDQQQVMQVSFVIANHKQFDCWQQHCEEYLQLLSKQPFDSAMLNPVNQTPKLKLEQSVLVDDIDVRCYLLTAVRKMCVQEQLCGNMVLAVAHYDPYTILLTEEIDKRRGLNQPFQERQLWYLLYVLTTTASVLHNRECCLKEVGSQNVFLNTFGQIKLASQVSWPQTTSIIDDKINKVVQKQKSQITQKNITDKISHQNYLIGLLLIQCILLQSTNESLGMVKQSNINYMEDHQELLKKVFRIKYYSLGLKLIVVGLAQIKIKDRLDVGEIARVLAPFAREIKEMNFMKLDYEAIKGEKLLSVKLNKLEYNHLKQIKSQSICKMGKLILTKTSVPMRATLGSHISQQQPTQKYNPSSLFELSKSSNSVQRMGVPEVKTDLMNRSWSIEDQGDEDAKRKMFRREQKRVSDLISFIREDMEKQNGEDNERKKNRSGIVGQRVDSQISEYGNQSNIVVKDNKKQNVSKQMSSPMRKSSKREDQPQQQSLLLEANPLPQPQIVISNVPNSLVTMSVKDNQSGKNPNSNSPPNSQYRRISPPYSAQKQVSEYSQVISRQIDQQARLRYYWAQHPQVNTRASVPQQSYFHQQQISNRKNTMDSPHRLLKPNGNEGDYHQSDIPQQNNQKFNQESEDEYWKPPGLSSMGRVTMSIRTPQMQQMM